jgi:outer membrane protein assembly factor BamB
LGALQSAISVAGPDRFPLVGVSRSVEQSDLVGLRPDSLRAFRVDADADAFELIARSGFDLAAMSFWLYVDRPGVYVIVGAPRDRLLAELIRGLARRRARRDGAEPNELTREAVELFVTGKREELAFARKALTLLELQTSRERFLPHDLRRTKEGQPEAFPLPGGAGLDALRRQLQGLETPERGLPEEMLVSPGDTWSYGPPWPVSHETLLNWPAISRALVERLIVLHLPWPLFCWLWPQDWWMYHANAWHTGVASGCSDIDSSTVSRLYLHRMVGVSGSVISIPTVVGGKAFVGTMTGSGGTLYRIDLWSGAIEHSFPVASNGGGVWGSGVAGSPAVVEGCVYFTAVDGVVYCLDADSFTEIWSTDLRHPDPGKNQYVNNSSPPVGCWPSPLVVEDRVYVGVGLGEDGPGPDAAFGVVYCLSADDGSVQWLFCTNQFTNGVDNAPNVIPPSLVSQALPPPFQAAPADPPTRGASVWSSCAYDDVDKRIFVGTGNPNPDHPLPNERYSSGVLSLNATTGTLHGFYQPAPADSYRPTDNDIDVPCPPTLFTRKGKLYVGCGSKNGSYFLLDPDAMTSVAKRQLLPYRNNDPNQPLQSVDPGAGENHSGVYGSAAFDAERGNLYVGLGGWGRSIDTPSTPFVRALDWIDLHDKWPTATGGDGVTRYTNGAPPLYANDGECGLGSPAVVNDLAFVPTNQPALYAFDCASGAKLWSATGLPPRTPDGDSSVVMGPAVSGNYVVIGCQGNVYIYSLWTPIHIPWWLLQELEEIVWPQLPPWPPPPPPGDGFGDGEVAGA